MPAKQTTTAFFRVSPSAGSIDKDNGIIRGVKLMELGKLARFAGEDGKHREVKITEQHISVLLGYAGNRALPIHKTHEWFDSQDKPDADSVELGARIGALKQFRKDDNGDLIADAFFKIGEERDSMLWSAEHNPEDVMFSAVFNYQKDDPNCLPVNFRCADVVPVGAATTALFSESTLTPHMDISELLALLDDPKCKDAIKAIVKSHKDPSDTSDETDAAAMEADAGVGDSDKKDEDTKKPAMMRALARISRKTARVLDELKAEKAAILAEAKVQSAAEATALLGKGGIVRNERNADGKDAVETALAPYISTGATRGTAILRFAKDKPKEYNTLRSAGKL